MKNNFDNNSCYRNENIDILKGIAIFLVVYGHSIQFAKGITYSQGLFFDNKIFAIIYSFHMPLFMIISGFLFYYSINKHLTKQLVSNKINSLLIPIITWAFFTSTLEILTNGMTINIDNYISNGLGSLWFLWAVFYCTIAVIIGNRIFNDNIIFYIIVLLILLLLPNLLNKDLYAYMYPYFILGYFANKNEFNLKHINFKVILILYLIMMFFWNSDYYIYTTNISLYKKDYIIYQLWINIYRWIIGFSGSVLVIVLINKLYSNFYNCKIASAIAYLGKNSLGIYILNIYLFSNVLLKIRAFISMNEALFTLICLLLSLIIVLISLFIIKFIKKIKVLNKFLLGDRIGVNGKLKYKCLVE